MNTQKFKAEELCSRKLWQLVHTAPGEEITDTDLSLAIAELVKRRHYLQDLQDIENLEDFGK
ncbi:MAG: hypothetical protein ACI9JM_000164 [Halioglobus sp.]|jgi:hypothetical protein